MSGFSKPWTPTRTAGSPSRTSKRSCAEAAERRGSSRALKARSANWTELVARRLGSAVELRPRAGRSRPRDADKNAGATTYENGGAGNGEEEGKENRVSRGCSRGLSREGS